jgi:uncharacterized membrane protein
MQEQLIPIGFLMIFLGILVIFIGIILSASKTKEARVEWGFGGFIGPLPFGFASREEMLKFIIIVSLVFLILFFILQKKLI